MIVTVTDYSKRLNQFACHCIGQMTYIILSVQVSVRYLPSTYSTRISVPSESKKVKLLNVIRRFEQGNTASAGQRYLSPARRHKKLVAFEIHFKRLNPIPHSGLEQDNT